MVKPINVTDERIARMLADLPDISVTDDGHYVWENGHIPRTVEDLYDDMEDIWYDRIVASSDRTSDAYQTLLDDAVYIRDKCKGKR